MPVLKKITAVEFNVQMPVEVKATKESKNCNPSVQVLDGMRTEVSDQYGVLVKRGAYESIIFVPNALLGELRWNRILNPKRNKSIENYNQTDVSTGVVFMINSIQ